MKQQTNHIQKGPEMKSTTRVNHLQYLNRKQPASESNHRNCRTLYRFLYTSTTAVLSSITHQYQTLLINTVQPSQFTYSLVTLEEGSAQAEAIGDDDKLHPRSRSPPAN
jgi:hypothetical protein